MNTDSDRRLHHRYPANHLKVLIKSLRNSEGEWEAGLISSVDFNRYGIGLETQHNFVIGDILSLIIRTDDSTLAEINGLVCNRTQTANGYRFGVRFEHENSHLEQANDAVINIREEIMMIERQAAAFIH